jgi:hypothetical protein
LHSIPVPEHLPALPSYMTEREKNAGARKTPMRFFQSLNAIPSAIWFAPSLRRISTQIFLKNCICHLIRFYFWNFLLILKRLPKFGLEITLSIH